MTDNPMPNKKQNSKLAFHFVNAIEFQKTTAIRRSGLLDGYVPYSGQ
jgi:hypothetical protein